MPSTKEHVAASTPGTRASADDVAGAVRGLTFTTLRDGNVDQLGIRTSRGIVNVPAAARALGIADPPLHVDDVVRGIGDVGSLARIASSAPATTIRSESSVDHGPLIRKPEKILCVGFNYMAHIAEFRESVPKFPDLFNKYNTALNRHNRSDRGS
jgi:2-keto-4-pentenoate hydratase/2-oxohepta-3-ene-1,7-dioic acid hydratase in catechol pathway